MDFIQLTQPTPKRLSSDSTLRAFPIDCINETDEKRPFTGIYTGLSVEIIDPDTIKMIHFGGNFGLSTKTKNTPRILDECPRVRNINQMQYDQKLAWNKKFGNQNPDLVMVNLLPMVEKNCDETEEKKSNGIKMGLDALQSEEKIENECGQSIPMDECGFNVDNVPVPMETDAKKPELELNLVVDPFPIEESLALSPEEAFFLHYSLRCLRVIDFNQTHELTTEEMLETFCNSDSKFIERYVVFHYYRSKNWIVKSGIKFGGEFCK